MLECEAGLRCRQLPDALAAEAGRLGPPLAWVREGLIRRETMHPAAAKRGPGEGRAESAAAPVKAAILW